MDYEVIHLKQKTVAGLTVRTANSSPIADGKRC